MLNIWQNTFYYRPPAISWLYVADFSNFTDFNVPEFNFLKDSEIKNPLNQAIVSLTIPDREVQLESVFYGGMEFPQYTRGNNMGTLTIKFNENSDYLVTRTLETIYNKFAYNANNYPLAEKPEKYRENNDNGQKIIINAYTYNGIGNSDNPNINDYAFSYEFDLCKLIKLDGYELSYESEDTITRTATFSYTTMTTKKNDIRILEHEISEIKVGE